MSLLKYLSIGMLAAGMLAGCGQTKVETIMVPHGEKPDAQGKGQTAVILPFADYSSGDRIASAFRRNLLITESLTDSLRRNGFALPVQEDVFQHLVEQKIINLAPYSENNANASSLASELEDPDWSDLMKEKIRTYIDLQAMQQVGGKNPAVDSPGTHGLTPQEVVKIGRNFGADYIIRGRILEFRTRQEHSWDPRKRGIIPFVTGTTSRIAFGFADSERYDNLGNKVAGGAWGAALGSNADWPWDADDSNGFFGVSGGKGANTIVWSVAGGALGDMATHSGQVDQAVVQMRIWVQDAYDAQVIWSNRVEVRVAPESVLADNQYDDLFDQAVKKAASSLIDDFVTYGMARQQL